MLNIFTKIYETKRWGNNKNNYYKGSSGLGSNIEYNISTYIPFLKKFIIDEHIKSVVDLGCGDFRTGTLIYDDLDVIYVGYDAYQKVIEYNETQHEPPKYNFVHADIFEDREKILPGDLCILKDVLQHWSNHYITAFLDYLINSKKFKYILICNCCSQKKDNDDIETGKGRHLSCRYLPLKKYNPKKLFNYHTKEVSLIEC